VDPDELLRAGICLNRETMQRQERFDPEFGDEAGWKRFVNAVRQCPEIEVTGAYVDGSLSAYVLACREDGWLHLLLQMSRTQELVDGISHALVFSTLQQAGRDPSILAVGNYYAGHLTTPCLDQFKTQMGFSVVTHNMSQRLHPGLAPLLTNRAAIAVLRVAQKAPPIRTKVESLTRIVQGDMISRNKNSGSGLSADQPCQHEEALGYSRVWRSHWLFLLWWYSRKVRKMGIRSALSKVPGFIRKRIRRRPECSTPAVPKPLATEEMLGLQPGDWVIVKSEEDITATLDKKDKNRGLLFTKEMHRYHGQRFRVFKRVEKIFMEESKQNRKVKNTVLLEGVHCQGLDLGCDKSCFLFWKEAWLRRAEQGPERLQFSPDDRT
jgi:hypothetical protein